MKDLIFENKELVVATLFLIVCLLYIFLNEMFLPKVKIADNFTIDGIKEMIVSPDGQLHFEGDHYNYIGHLDSADHSIRIELYRLDDNSFAGYLSKREVGYFMEYPAYSKTRDRYVSGVEFLKVFTK